MNSYLKKIFLFMGFTKQKMKSKSSGINYDNYLEEMFGFFHTPWKSKFLIGGKSYGGENDYSSKRISMLNLPEVISNVQFEDKRILELGPLEGGNTIKLEGLNPKSILSIEGRVESYLKCCMVKNLYDLNRSKFYLDDVMNISKEKYGSFDIAVVLGLLYHLDKPHVLLNELSRMVNTLIISTHYADNTSPYPNAEDHTIITPNGKYYGRLYIEDPASDPNAGLQFKSFWPYEKDLIQMCKDSGFSHIKILARNPDPNEQYKLIYFIASKNDFE